MFQRTGPTSFIEEIKLSVACQLREYQTGKGMQNTLLTGPKPLGNP